MQLRDFFSADAIGLDLGVQTKAEAISAMVALLRLPPDTCDTLRKLLDRREQLGSTGVGHGIAIPLPGGGDSAAATGIRPGAGRVPTMPSTTSRSTTFS